MTRPFKPCQLSYFLRRLAATLWRGGVYAHPFPENTGYSDLARRILHEPSPTTKLIPLFDWYGNGLFVYDALLKADDGKVLYNPFPASEPTIDEDEQSYEIDFPTYRKFKMGDPITLRELCDKFYHTLEFDNKVSK